MQKSLFLLICTISLIVTYSCKDGSTSTSQATSTENVSPDGKVQEELEGMVLVENTVSPDQIKAWRNSAQSILEFRRKNDANKSWAVLESGLWEYEFIFSDGKMSEPGAYKGQWIDFHQDLTFTYGTKGETLGKGQYHYSPDSGILLMIDDDSSKKPIEYNLKFAGDVMTYTGTPEYKDNGKQGKLGKLSAVPN